MQQPQPKDVALTVGLTHDEFCRLPQAAKIYLARLVYSGNDEFSEYLYHKAIIALRLS